MPKMDVGTRIKAARKAKGWTQVQLAEAIGLKQPTVAEMEGGKLKNWPLHADKIMRALEKPRSYFEGASRPAPQPSEGGGALTPHQDSEVEALPQSDKRLVPLIGKVEAGVWAEIPDEPVVEDEIPVWLPEYDRARLSALRVSGRSMDLIYSEGSVVVYAPAAEAGVRFGDIVVVQRHRGPFVETTLKEVVQEADGSLALYPRSSDPQYKPLPFSREADADNGVAIIGVVVYHADPTRRGRGPLVGVD